MAPNEPTHSRFFSMGLSILGLLSAAATVACMATLTGFLGRLWWPLELTSHFRAQYFLFLVGAGVVFFVARRRRAALLTAAFAIPNLLVIVPIYLSNGPGEAGNQSLKVVLMNVNLDNVEYARACSFVEETNPDLLVALEVTSRWWDELHKRLSGYPHRMGKPLPNNFGILLLSRIPLDDARVWSITGDDMQPSVRAGLSVGGKTVTVFGIHPPPPVMPVFVQERLAQMEGMSRLVSREEGNVRVLGDFNMTSWSPIFQDFLRTSGLKDSRQGIGIQASWPVDLPFLRIPVDHCLVSKKISVISRRLGPNIGSDHYPVIIEVGMH